MIEMTRTRHFSSEATLFKVTDGAACTTNRVHWGKSVSHDADELFAGSSMSRSAAYLHAYRSLELAAIFAPVHLGQFDRFRLWNASGRVRRLSATSAECVQLMTIDEIAFPRITVEHRLHFLVTTVTRIFTNDAWRTWALRWLATGEFIRHHAEIAKRAAKSAGSIAEQVADDSEQQYSLKLNLYRGRQVFTNKLSPFINMPEGARLDASWDSEVSIQEAKADAVAAQAACWASDAVMNFERSNTQDKRCASHIFEGQASLPGSWLGKATSYLSGRHHGERLALAVNEALGWAESAAELRAYAAATKAEAETRQDWIGLQDASDRQAYRDEVRQTALKETALELCQLAAALTRGNH